MVKPPSLSAVILVRDLIDISYFNNILTLGDCVGQRLMLEIILRYWSTFLVCFTVKSQLR